jgi:acetyl esterase/lipase
MEPDDQTHVLEPAAAAFARAARQAPSIHERDPGDARQVLERLQSGPVSAPEVEAVWLSVATAGRPVRVRLVRPAGAQDRLPALLYLHGGGWIMGSAATHDRLVRELAAGAGIAVVFVEYDRAPEAAYPVALEQAYAVARWIHRDGARENLDPDRMAVAGDSAGGNLAAAVTIRARQRGEFTFEHQSLFYPSLDPGQGTASYREFADGPHLTARAMRWFWDAYLSDLGRGTEITAAPIRAAVEDLSGLPDTLLIVGECDVLRDEGEAYARKLTAAGVRCSCVRYNGAIHDFMVLNAVRKTAAAGAAIAQAVDVIHRALRPADELAAAR